MLDYLCLVAVLFRTGLRRHGELVAETLLLRHQLAVLTRPTRKRPRLRAGDRLFWVMAARLWRGGRRPRVLVRPETVVRWHRQGGQRFWRGKSRPGLGRPRRRAG
jgi:hypothetical protein